MVATITHAFSDLFVCTPGGFYYLDAFWFSDWEVVYQSTDCKFRKANLFILIYKPEKLQLYKYLFVLLMFFIEPSWILVFLFVSVQSYLKEFSFSNANQDDLWTHIQMVLIFSLVFLLCYLAKSKFRPYTICRRLHWILGIPSSVCCITFALLSLLANVFRSVYLAALLHLRPVELSTGVERWDGNSGPGGVLGFMAIV